MKNLDEFKEYVNKHPKIQELVKENKYSWQELFERYSKNGEEDELFKEKIENKKNLENNFFDTLSSIDVDKVSEALNSMKKILNVISEVTSIETPSTKRKNYSKGED